MDITQTSKVSAEEIQTVLRCEGKRKHTLFIPAIYEHKGWFIDKTPSDIARDADLLARGALAEYEVIHPDALTVGVDVYNIEAEALGCKVTFYEKENASIPGIEASNHAFHMDHDFTNAPIPNPLRDGRMPIYLEATRRVKKELGNDLWIRGAVSGPFSLAANLVGSEELFMTCLKEPERVFSLMDYACRIIKEYGKAYIDLGAGLVMFDSQSSPDMVSRQIYETFILPSTKNLIHHFKSLGVDHVPLIVGGNTVPIIDLLMETGANNLLCDFTASWEKWAEAGRKNKRAIRRNISSRFMQNASPEEIYQATRKEIELAGDFPGFIMGTAVICYGTPTEKILAVKNACMDADRQ